MRAYQFLSLFYLGRVPLKMLFYLLISISRTSSYWPSYFLDHFILCFLCSCAFMLHWIRLIVYFFSIVVIALHNKNSLIKRFSFAVLAGHHQNTLSTVEKKNNRQNNEQWVKALESVQYTLRRRVSTVNTLFFSRWAHFCARFYASYMYLKFNSFVDT